MNNISADDYIYALKNVVSYNNLWQIIKRWKNIPRNSEYGFVSFQKDYGAGCEEEKFQLEVIWMIAVSLFGNYGTSPRSGWIEGDKYNDFCKWIDTICEDCDYAE